MTDEDFTSPRYEGDQTEICYTGKREDGKPIFGSLFLGRLIPPPNIGQSMDLGGERFAGWQFVVDEVSWTILESGGVHLWIGLTGREE